MAGDFIQEVRNDTVIAREGPGSVMYMGIVAAPKYPPAPPSALPHERRGFPPAGVGEVLRVVITKQELQALRESLVYRDGKSVVVAAPVILRAYDAIPKRIRSVLDRVPESYGIGRHLGEIGVHRQISTMAAVVGDAQAGLEAQITLYSKVPLLDIGILVVGIEGDEKVLRAWLCEICRKRIGERVLCLSIADRIGEACHITRLHGPRRLDQVAKRRVDIFPISAADHRLAVSGGAPGKADTRGEVGFLRITQTGGNAGLARRQDGRRGD